MSRQLSHEERRRRAAIVADDARFDALLEAAFRVAVPEARRSRDARRRWPAAVAIAAGLLLAVGAWLALPTQSPDYGASQLAPDVIAHIQHEPQALAVTARAVPRAQLDHVLQRGRARFTEPVGQVSYAKLCPFRGQLVAHFVVQGAQGPVTVLLLPDEHVPAPMPIHESGFKGTVMPAKDGGSIVIVGQPDEDLNEIRDLLLQAIRWRL